MPNLQDYKTDRLTRRTDEIKIGRLAGSTRRKNGRGRGADHVISYERFSSLRLIGLFPEDRYVAEHANFPDDERDYAWEYLGGQWDSHQIPGVELMFPSEAESQVGSLTVSMVIPGIEENFRDAEGAGSPSRRDENAARVLPVLELPFQFRDDLATVKAAIKGLGGKITSNQRQKDIGLTWLEFTCNDPEPYQINLTVHDGQGLRSVEMIRKDLAKRNAMDED